MASKERIQNGPSLYQARPDTPPNSSDSSTSGDAESTECPIVQAPATPLTIEHLEMLFEKLVQAKSPDSVSDETKTGSSGDAQPKGARASKLDFKTVNEMYVSD